MKKAVFISLFLICVSLSSFAQTSIQGRETDVRAWGAKCDASTNDTSAIQAAITAMATAGGIVNLPDGTCIVTGLSVPGGVTLRGKGKSTTFIKSSTNGVILDLVQGAGTYLFRGPTVQQLTVEGSSSGGSQIGINIDDPVYFLDVVVQDVAVTATGSHGVYFGKVFSSLFDNITAGSSNAGYPFLFNQVNMPGNTFRNLYAGDVNSTSPAGFRIRSGNITCWGCNGINNSSSNSWWAIIGDKVGVDGAVANRAAYLNCIDCNIESSRAGGILHYYNSRTDLSGATLFSGDAGSAGTYIALKYEVDSAIFPPFFVKGVLSPSTTFANSPLSYYANSEVIHANDLPPVSIEGAVRQADGNLINTYYNTTNARSEAVYRVDGARPVTTITATASFTNPGATNYEANCAAPCTLTLPWPSWYTTNTDYIYVRNIGAGTLTINANSGGTVNSGGSYTLVTGESVVFMPHTASADYRLVGLQGAGAANRIPYFDGVQHLTSSANLTYDGTTVLNQKAGGNPYFAANDTTNNITTRFGPLAGAPDRAIIGTISNHPFGLYANNAERWTVGTAGHFTPGAANTTDLGSVSLPARSGYFGTSVLLGVGSSVTGQAVFSNSSNTNTTTLQSGAPSSSISITLPATLPASVGCLQISSTGVITQTGSACGAGGGSVEWQAITDPTGNEALAMGAYTTAWTWNATTGANNLFTLTDTASNTGTGYIASIGTAASSSAKPIRITAGGTSNGVEMTTAGALVAIGSGEIRATTANPSATIGLTANNGSATTAMRSDATPALSQAIAPTWTGLHTFNPGTTPQSAILLTINAIGSPGTRDSHDITFRGRSDNGTPHTVDWKLLADVTTNAGASQFVVRSNLDGGSFSDWLTIADNGLIAGGDFFGATFTTAGGSILDDDINAATGFTVNSLATNGTILRANGTRYAASSFTMATPGTTGNVLTSDGTNWISSAPTGGGLGDPGANGIVARTALNTTTARTITGTANKITVTDGSGVSGNPTLTLPVLLSVDDVELSNGSAIATGTSNGNTFNLAAYDVDGTTYTDLLRLTAGNTPTISFILGSDATGDIWYRNSGGAITRLPIGNAGQVLTVSSGLPSWQDDAPIIAFSDLASSAANVTFSQSTFNTTFNHTTGLLAASWSGNTTTSNAFALSHSNTTATGTLLNLSTSASVNVKPLTISPRGNQSFQADHLGNIVVGNAALATNATDGFLYMPSSAGVPTGTPTSYTGRVPVEVDTTNSRLYGYFGGAWVNLSGSGGGGLGDPGANGVVVRTALNTTTARTITAGSSGGLTVTNGDGVSGNPTIDLTTTNTSGLGFALPGGGGIPIVGDTSAALVGSADEVRVVLFYAPMRVTVDRIGVNGVTNGSGNSAGFGIYTADGNTKVCDSGAISTTSWSGAAAYTLSGSCTFGPGYYYYAWTANNTTPTIRSGSAFTNYFAPLNVGTGTVLGTAANASSGGVLPSTLGTLTDSNSLAVPIVRWFKN